MQRVADIPSLTQVFSTPSNSGVRTYTKTFNSDTAYEWLESFKYPRQRPVKESTVKDYTRDMVDGRWRPGSELKVAFIRTDVGAPVGYGLSFQHRMWALIAAAEEKPGIEIEFVVIEYYVNTMEEVNELYTVVDHNARRSSRDMTRAFDLAKELDIPEAFVSRMTGAVRAIQGNFLYTTRSIASQLIRDLIREWKPEITELYKIHLLARGEFRHHLYAAPYAAVALVTLRYQREKALEFWNQVAEDDRLAIDDPRKVLRNYMLTSTTHGLGFRKRVVTPQAQQRAAAAAWNYFFDERPLKKLNVREESTRSAIYIKGTPYKGE